MANKLKRIFWDIESYINLFCCGMLDDNDFLEMFYLVHNPVDEAELIRACEASGFKYKAYDLSKDVSRFKWHFEKRIPRTETTSVLADFLGVEDKEVLPKENWYFSFNGLNYDIPMCDHVIESTLANRLQTTAESLRSYSNTLIEGTARYVSTRPYEEYANQVDCAMLNETMVDKGRPTVGLKTLVGIKGGSIVESESNKTGVSKDIFGDVLYNINDITELRDVTYPGKMETTFKIRHALLEKYEKLRQNGITVNSTSAKFVEYIVSPDGPIIDTPTVSFMYPAPHVAEKLGVPQTDVLEDMNKWYMEEVYTRIAKNNPDAANAHLVKWMSVYEYYAAVRGKNWNDSALHAMTFGIPAQSKSMRADLFDIFGTYLPFIDEYGNDSNTYVNFSLGGIHGAEVNHYQLYKDRKEIKRVRDTYGKISMIPKGEISAKLLNLIKIQSRTPNNGYPDHLSHEIPKFFHETEQSDDIIDPEQFTPYMYNKSKKKEELIARYKYTSIGASVHQDFAGYYPMLLINLGAFYDGQGKDPYEEVYNHRIAIKRALKSLEFGTLEWELTNIEQEGYKLVLNSASGVLDGSFDTNLRANNKAMSMRIIGQLFTFKIGMVLALEGAKIPSSNTDGIYVFDMELEKNKRLVDAELEKLYVQIDPEPVYLVSKDANNRMEMEDGEVTSARGATLTSWEGARVDNRLSHPAIVDMVMTYYLQHEGVLDGEANKDLIRESLNDYLANPRLVKSFEDYPDAMKRTVVYMASWVMRSSSGSIMVDNNNEIYPGTIRTWLTKSGVMLTKYGTRNVKPSETLEDYASKLFPDTRLGDPDVITYLTEIGAYEKHLHRAITVEEYYEHRTEVTKPTSKKRQFEGESVYIIGQSKISHLPEETLVTINNHSILKLTEDEVSEIYDALDMESYVDMIADFARTWQNIIVD